MSNIKEMRDECSRFDYSRSSSKRLFASVFRIVYSFVTQLDHDDLETSAFDDNDTNGSCITSILCDDNLRSVLSQKVRAEGLNESYPILKISCVDNNNQHHPLDR